MADVPNTLNNVPRVDARGSEETLRNHLERQTPVIVRDTQAGAPISRILTEHDAVEAFGDVLIQVQQNYTSPLSRNTASARRRGLSQKVRNRIDEMRLSDYLTLVREQPDTDMLCVEYRTPDTVLASMTVPEICTIPRAIEDMVSFTFVANKGNYAHLHFDGDFRNVVLYQVFGRKRVVMVPLAAQDKISPSMNFSKLLIQNMDDEEKLHLLRYLGAYDCLLGPGEAIYFPPSIWHYVEYLDTGMSVNFRFGRDAFAQKVVDANRVPFYPELHLLLAQVSQVADQTERASLQDKIWAEVGGVLRRDYPTTRDRHLAVQEMYRRLLDLVPDSGRTLPRQVSENCPIAEEMAIERYDSPSKRWREELMLGAPI